MSEHTIAGMAERLSVHEGRPEGAAALERALRNVAKNHGLRSHRKQGEGLTAAALYADEELAFARVCLALLGGRVDAPQIQQIRYAVAKAGAWGEAVQAVRQGERRWLIVEHHLMPGMGRMLFAYLDDGPPPPPKSGEPIRSQDIARADESDGILETRRRDAPSGLGMVEMVTVLPLHVILAGLLPALAAAPASQPAAADNA